MFGVVAKHSPQIAEIVLIHGDDEIVIVVVFSGDLSRLTAFEFYAFLKQNTLCRRIDVIANLFG